MQTRGTDPDSLRGERGGRVAAPGGPGTEHDEADWHGSGEEASRVEVLPDEKERGAECVT